MARGLASRRKNGELTNRISAFFKENTPKQEWQKPSDVYGALATHLEVPRKRLYAYADRINELLHASGSNGTTPVASGDGLSMAKNEMDLTGEVLRLQIISEDQGKQVKKLTALVDVYKQLVTELTTQMTEQQNRHLKTVTNLLGMPA